MASSFVHALSDYEYAIFELQVLDDVSSSTWAVNDFGVAVGSSLIESSLDIHGFVEGDFQVFELGTLGGRDSEALDINSEGIVVGYAHALDARRAFMWTLAGGMVDLGDLGGLASHANAINDQGQIVGYAFPPDQSRQAFIWDDGIMTGLSEINPDGFSEARDVNELGVAVGMADDQNGTDRPVMWIDNEIIDLGSLGDGTHSGTAWGINDLNQVVGQSYNDNNKQLPFLWAEGTMYKLGNRDGLATDINNSAHIVGLVERGGDLGAFVWEQSTGMRYLDDLIPPKTRITLTRAKGISDTGIIVADGPDPDQCEYCDRSFRLIPVDPELTLSDPVPGMVGETNTWMITGAQPGAKIHFAYSFKGGGTVVPGCDKLDAVVQLIKPKVVKTVTADANGEATIDLYVPPAASNAGLILFQAVDVKNCNESQLTTFDFP